MDVEVDDRHLSRPLHPGVRGGDGDVVVETKTHRPIAFGMMPRRPNQCHGGTVRPTHDPLHRVHGGAGGQERNFIRFRRRVRVRIEAFGAAVGFGNDLQVRRVMDTSQVLARRSPRRHDLDAALPPPVGNDVEDLGPFRPFGVAGRRLMLGESIAVNQEDRHRL